MPVAVSIHEIYNTTSTTIGDDGKSGEAFVELTTCSLLRAFCELINFELFPLMLLCIL